MVVSPVLILSPHADDGEIGCGASIVKHLVAGNTVKFVVFSGCRKYDGVRDINILRKELEASMKRLGVTDWEILDFEDMELEARAGDIRQKIHDLYKEYEPEYVYIPYSGSRHEDHVTVYESAIRVLGRKEVKLLGYYIIGDGNTFKPTYFETFQSLEPIQKKLDAIKSYGSQRQSRKWFNTATVEATLRFWASFTNNAYAEAFEVIKWVNWFV